MANHHSPVTHSHLPCVRVPLDGLSPGQFHGFKGDLLPFVATDCFLKMQHLKHYAKNMGNALCSDVELTDVFAECSAMSSHEEIESPRYYGHSASGSSLVNNNNYYNSNINEDSSSITSPSALVRSPADASGGRYPSSQTLEKSSTDVLDSSGVCPQLFTSVGGLEIMSDDNYKRKELLSLKVSYLQHRHSQPAVTACVEGDDDTAASDCNEDDEQQISSDTLSQTSMRSLSILGGRRHPGLTLQDGRNILVERRAVRSGEPCFLRSSIIPSDSAVANALLNEYGNLYVKAPIQQSKTLMDSLHISTLFFGKSGSKPLQPVCSALRLQPGTYVAYAMLAEKGAGTRTHENVKGSHGWHLLLSGRKRWYIVHPLDKHLIIDPDTGKLLGLSDKKLLSRNPNAKHARVYSFVQEAGEAVFIPSEAVHYEASLEDSVSILVKFMDSSSKFVCQKHNRYHEILEAPQNKESFQPEIMPLTTVDIMLFTDNVYPSFRGKDRQYRPDTRQTTLLLRGIAEFGHISMPCSELGARLELEAFQNCFSALGEALLNLYDPPRYVVGVPKGYMVSPEDKRLILYYYTESYSLDDIKQCLQQHPHIGQSMQHFTCPGITLPEIELFRSTASHQGRIPNYLPLSVILNQIWPFERDLCQRLVSLPHIILDKAYHPLGFIRPGSVWHYARFDIYRQQKEATCSHTESTEVSTTLDTAPSCRNSNSNNNNHYDEDTLSFSHPVGVSRQRFSAAPNLNANRLSARADHGSSFDYVDTELEEYPGEGWCQTFLFYCSPIMEKPVAMHPLCTNVALQDGTDMTEKGSLPTFSPRILEFEWNANRLEKYGMVSLLELEKNGINEIKKKILTDRSFDKFEQFVEAHCLRAIDHNDETNIEKVMSVVMWFMCRPCVVGFTFGSTLDPSHDTPLVDGGSSVGAGVRELDQWDTVCLTATAASALLSCVPCSIYATLATKICNWLCNAPSSVSDEELFRTVEAVLRDGNVEEQAVLVQVLRIKKHNLEKHSTPSHHSISSADDDALCLHDQEAFGLANAARIQQLEAFCREVEKSIIATPAIV